MARSASPLATSPFGTGRWFGPLLAINYGLNFVHDERGVPTRARFSDVVTPLCDDAVRTIRNRW